MGTLASLRFTVFEHAAFLAIERFCVEIVSVNADMWFEMTACLAGSSSPLGSTTHSHNLGIAETLRERPANAGHI